MSADHPFSEAPSVLGAPPVMDVVPMTSLSYDRAGNKIRQHFLKIDLRPEDIDLLRERSCYRATVCTHFPKTMTGRFADGLMDAKLIKPFEMQIRPFERCGRSHASFKLRYGVKGDAPFTMSEAKDYMERLLVYLNSVKLDIIWKEGEHGYVIEPDGKIKRKWNLDPF